MASYLLCNVRNLCNAAEVTVSAADNEGVFQAELGRVAVKHGREDSSKFFRNVADTDGGSDLRHGANGVGVIGIVFPFEPYRRVGIGPQVVQVRRAIFEGCPSEMKTIALNHSSTSLLAIGAKGSLLAAPIAFVELFLIGKGHGDGFHVAPGATPLGVVFLLGLFAHFVITDHGFFLLVIFICTPVYS